MSATTTTSILPPRAGEQWQEPAGLHALIQEIAGALWVDQQPKANPEKLSELCAAGDMEALSRLAAAAPSRFCATALVALRTGGPAVEQQQLIRVLLESDLLLIPLCDPLSFRRTRALAIAARYAEFCPDVAERILCQMRGRPEANQPAITGLAADRAMEIAAATGNPRHLRDLLYGFLNHPNPRLRSKAALLIAKACRDPLWVGQRIMLEPDARLRANLVEALWGLDDEDARAVLWDAAGDANNRVVANALVGLHKINEVEVPVLLRRMAAHPQPLFRSSAAWAMSQTGDQAFLSHLEALGGDIELSVRRMADRALARLRNATSPQPSSIR
jgi:HEAT repeat protein